MTTGEMGGMEPLFSGQPTDRTAFERSYDEPRRSREELAEELVKSLPTAPFETGFAERHGDKPSIAEDATPEDLSYSA